MEDFGDIEPDVRMHWARLLNQCIDRFGDSPRRISVLEKVRIFWSILRWSGDPVVGMEKSKYRLLKEGNIVWAHIVQANHLLFSPGFMDGPADILFCTDPYTELAPPELSYIAGILYDAKENNSETEENKKAVLHLRNEMERVKGIKFRYKDNVEVVMSTILISRKAIPHGFLLSGYFPCIVFPEGDAMILPEKYWGPDLKSIWSQNPEKALINANKVQEFFKTYVLNIVYFPIYIMLSLLIAMIVYTVTHL